MDKWTMILLEMEDMWANSVEYKFLPIDISAEDYENRMANYKAQRIYDLYGYEYAVRFMSENPHAKVDIEQLPSCRQQAGLPQCSLFCHNYDLVKGCMLNADEQLD